MINKLNLITSTKTNYEQMKINLGIILYKKNIKKSLKI